MTKIAVIGTGVMGETLISGLLGSGWQPAQITAVDRYAPKLAEIADKYGVGSAELAEAVADADAVLVVTKPQDVAAVLPQVAAGLRSGALVVSVCAGVTTAQIESYLTPGTAVVRVMPNTPAQVGEGMAAISAGAWAAESDLEFATGLLKAVGKVVTVPEKYQDAVTAVSGSGPAYVFYVVEAMIDAGVLLGLPRDIATTLAVQTVYGSAKLLVESGAHPTQLRERVTSPGGTTAAALRELDDNRVKAAFMAAIEAARDRSEELSED
jgi:pyrroline-5-carboxylate reductase